MAIRKREFSRGELNARAEALMMGFVIKREDIDSIKYIIDYVSKTLRKTVTADEIIKEAYKYIKEKDKVHVVGLSLNTLMEEMQVLTLIFKEDEEDNFDIENEDGVFCYCYNYTCPDYSELGYSFFKNENGRIHRIG